VPSDASLELLDGGVKRGIRLPAPLGCLGRMHDRRVVTPEELSDPRVGRRRHAAAEIHRELARNGDVLCTAAGTELRRAHGEPLAYRSGDRVEAHIDGPAEAFDDLSGNVEA